MNLVTHKYIAEQMPEQELRAIFAARQHTLDYLVEELRRQDSSTTLSSYLVTGPRGSGKSTILRMLRFRIRDDIDLARAWLPVAFPEEQFNVASLRDLFAAALKTLAERGNALAGAWLEKVEAESDDEQSEELAVAGLKEVARQQNKRLILFIENLEEFFERTVTDRMKGTLRRLLMTNPFMLIMGSAVHMFESLRNYDEAFFNYFCPVPLTRLNEQEVFDLLAKRARFDHNELFSGQLPGHRAQIATIAHLSGGNPRVVLFLYELLSQKQVITIVQQLRRLVDELTPMLKHELENLPAQQQKIIHALMERGGVATPSELTGPTRLSLNAVTQQLRRLKESQILELRGGGKGRTAHYTVPDKLFSIWYQMRYLNSRRRHIEMFVEVLRVWFETEERLKLLQDLTAASPHPGVALTAEYFAASLAGTPHEDQARDLCLRQWLRVQDIHEAALANAEFARFKTTDEQAYETLAYAGLCNWFLNREDPQTAVEALKSVAQQSNDPNLLIQFGTALSAIGDYERAKSVLDRAVKASGPDSIFLPLILIIRSSVSWFQGDTAGAIADCTAIIELPQSEIEQLSEALNSRGGTKRTLDDTTGAIADFTTVIELPQAPVKQVAVALFNRGATKQTQGDTTGAIADFTAVIELPQAPVEEVAKALGSRGRIKEQQGDIIGAVNDYTTAIELPNIPAEHMAYVLVMRGAFNGKKGEYNKSLEDFGRTLNLKGISSTVRALGLSGRGLGRLCLGQTQDAMRDWLAALDLREIPVDNLCNIADMAYTTACRGDLLDQAVLVPQKFAVIVADMDDKTRITTLTRWLSGLAKPEMKAHWTRACRTLLEHQPKEVIEALLGFVGAADVLERGDLTVLDTMPPEQRDFAMKVLERFQLPRATTQSPRKKSKRSKRPSKSKP